MCFTGKKKKRINYKKEVTTYRGKANKVEETGVKA